MKYGQGRRYDKLMKSCLPQAVLPGTVINLLLTTGTLCLNTLKAKHQFTFLLKQYPPSQLKGQPSGQQRHGWAQGLGRILESGEPLRWP